MVCCCFLKIDHNSSGFGQGNYYGTGKIYSPLGQTTTFTPRCNPILSYHLCWEMDSDTIFWHLVIYNKPLQ